MLSELLLPLLLVSFDENHTILGLLADVVVTIDDRGVQASLENFGVLHS